RLRVGRRGRPRRVRAAGRARRRRQPAARDGFRSGSRCARRRVVDPAGHELGAVVLLAVDIGNTNTVLALFDHGGLLATWRIGTDRRATADELALKVRGLLGSDVAAISGVAACSTVPALRRELHDMLGRYHADVP